MPEKIAKGARLTGASRERLAAELRAQYEQGNVSIRDIAAETGRSYGFVHRLLTESGVKLRGRGGATRRRKRQHAPGHSTEAQQTQQTQQSQTTATPSETSSSGISG